MRFYQEEKEEILKEIEEWINAPLPKNSELSKNGIVKLFDGRIRVVEKINFDINNYDDDYHHEFHKWIFISESFIENKWTI